MSRTNQILLAVLVVQIILVAVVRLADTKPVVAKLTPIVSINQDDVTKIELFGATTTNAESADADKKNEPAIALERTGDQWKLSSHFDYPADKKKAEELLGKIAGMKARSPVATGQARHRHLRVAEDKYERRVRVTSGGETTEFFIGTSAGRQQTAIRIKGEDKTFGVTGITAYAANVTPSSWLNTEYFKAAGSTEKLSVTNSHGNFEFARADAAASWTYLAADGTEVPAPTDKELDGEKIAALVSNVSTVRLSEPADPALVGSGSDTVTVKFNAGEKNHTLTITPTTGTEVDGKYVVRVDENRPVLVTKSALEGLATLAADTLFRDPPKPEDTPPPTPGPGGQQIPPELLRQLQDQALQNQAPR